MTTYSFDPSTDLPRLDGRVAVVTGANSGIGKVTAKQLAEHGATVVLACRNVEAGQEAAGEMAGDTRVEELDLSSQESIRQFAARWEGPLDLLINNAGVMTPPRYRETTDGHELQFGTNHLGPFALTGRLLPALLRADRPRVVAVASIAHHSGGADVVDGNPRQGYSPQHTYGNTKLANLLFARELQRRASEAGSKLTVASAHPGVSATNLVGSPDGMGAIAPVRWAAPLVTKVLFQSAARGAEPTLYAATLADPGSYTGPQRLRESRGPIGPARLSRLAQDDTLARKLWTVSEERTGITYAFDA